MAKELLEGPQAEIEKDLEATQPAVAAAVAAANTVNAADLKEFKGLKAPPAGCAEVMHCVMLYLCELPPTAKSDWQRTKKLMSIDIMSRILSFDKDGISDKVRFPVPPLSKSPIPSRPRIRSSSRSRSRAVTPHLPLCVRCVPRRRS